MQESGGGGVYRGEQPDKVAVLPPPKIEKICMEYPHSETPNARDVKYTLKKLKLTLKNL